MKTGKNHTAELIFSFFCLGPRPDDHVYFPRSRRVSEKRKESKEREERERKERQEAIEKKAQRVVDIYYI